MLLKFRIWKQSFAPRILVPVKMPQAQRRLKTSVTSFARRETIDVAMSEVSNSSVPKGCCRHYILDDGSSWDSIVRDVLPQLVKYKLIVSKISR